MVGYLSSNGFELHTDLGQKMIHNIPQPVLEQELTNQIGKDPNITLVKGFSIHAVDQVSYRPADMPIRVGSRHV